MVYKTYFRSSANFFLIFLLTLVKTVLGKDYLISRSPPKLK